MTAVLLWIFTALGVAHVIATLLRAERGGREHPGPLAGIWEVAGPDAETLHFRRGEAESSDGVDKVSYLVHGDQVIVTVEEGATRGRTRRYTVIDHDVALDGAVTLRKIR